MRYSLLVAILIALMQSGSALPPRVAIVRATFITWEDEKVTVMVQVEPHAENRALVLRVLDDGFEARTSLIQLDGEKAWKTHRVEWQRVPYGEDMALVAMLYDDAGKVVASARRTITVLARR